LLPGIVIAALLRESRAQVGASFDRIGNLLDQLFIEHDGLIRVSSVESFASLVIECLWGGHLAIES
jgi:hypothetical protein